MGGGGATRMMRRRPWDIVFANARQGRKWRWRDMLGGGGAACTMRQRSWDTHLPSRGGGEG